MVPLVRHGSVTVVWFERQEAIELLKTGNWDHARNFFLIQESRYAKLRRQLEMQMAEHNIERVTPHGEKA